MAEGGAGSQPSAQAAADKPVKKNEAGEDLYWDDEFGYYRKDRAWTMNEIRDLPMFMDDVPADISGNADLLALQSLIYDDGQTDEEIAEHFRKLGNEAFRSSTNRVSSQNALNAYTRGLEVECKDAALNSQLHSNRAAVSMRLKQWTKAVEDCRQAVKLDATNLKAWFRGAKSCEALGLTSKALEFCEEAKKLSPKEAEIVQMYSRLKKRLEKENADREKARKADEARAKARNSVDDKVRAVLDDRGVALGPVLYDMAMYRRGEQFRPLITEDDPASLQWPLVFLYDEYGQSDFVEAVDERCCLEDQLQVVFPQDQHAEWDEEKKYVWDKLVAYFETHHRAPDGGVEQRDGLDGTRCLPAPLDVPVAELIQTAGIAPLCLVVHVLVRGSAAHEAFCRTHELPLN
eukprot:TRINITY_DN56034_c0_g1_i1.p1 TRINITY_DN56034_c0_g1~~TRINITY_DN56034_c0_g1_i1.p1  ORF type:complete len:404 (+),score=80.80 TRINITY_DN56034_c0_g1_i1:66-1277(+)